MVTEAKKTLWDAPICTVCTLYSAIRALCDSPAGTEIMLTAEILSFASSPHSLSLTPTPPPPPPALLYQVDGLGDGILLEAEGQEAEFVRNTAFGMLQGCRMRNTKTVSGAEPPSSGGVVCVHVCVKERGGEGESGGGEVGGRGCESVEREGAARGRERGGGEDAGSNLDEAGVPLSYHVGLSFMYLHPILDDSFPPAPCTPLPARRSLFPARPVAARSLTCKKSLLPSALAPRTCQESR